MKNLDDLVTQEDLRKTLADLEELKARRADEIRRWEEYVETVKLLGTVTEKDILQNIAIMLGLMGGFVLFLQWLVKYMFICNGG